MHLIDSQMYLEHCHPILNHDIALTIALIAIVGNSINMYYLNPTTSRLSLLLHEFEAKPRTSVNSNDNL